MLLPGPIEQRRQSVIENIEERRHGAVPGRFARDQPFGIEEWQYALRAGEPQECHRNARRTAVLGRPHFVYRAGRKCHGEMCLEPRDLFRRPGRAFRGGHSRASRRTAWKKSNSKPRENKSSLREEPVRRRGAATV